VERELDEQITRLEQTPLHKLADVLPAVVKRILFLAQDDNSILHQGSLMSRLSFPSVALDKLLELKTFATAKSTWQQIENDNTHKAFKLGSRSDFCRTLCTVETLILMLANADMQELTETGNFVIKDPSVVAALQEQGMWQLQVPRANNKQTWNAISDNTELMWQAARLPDNATLICNTLELSETWTSRIDGIQLQNVKSTLMTTENCRRFVNMWISLLTEEKTRQRVAKAANYDFMEHDKLNLPWKFDIAGGYKTLPVVIWIKKEGDKKPKWTSPGQSQPQWVPFWSSSSGGTWGNWHGANWWSQ